MTQENNQTDEFLAALDQSLVGGSFVKLTLGQYTGPEEGLKQIIIRHVVVKREDKLSFTYRYKTRDIVKNYGPGEAFDRIATALEGDFKVGTLFTTEFDLSTQTMKRTKPTHKDAPSTSHDRDKVRTIEAKKTSWLYDLKITDANGTVFKTAQDKFRQINKYVEILSPLLKNTDTERTLRIADMGSGKGYLTFALYDYLTKTLGLKAEVTGVEYRTDMVALCNEIAIHSDFDGLKFVEGGIAEYEAGPLDMLIALHACDTATDDAIAKGIAANAEWIVVAPCCHKQIRREIEGHKAQNDLGFLLKHGIFVERQAEMVTDGLRSLILEYCGYSTKVFEFISDAHTPKNVMITATKNPKAKLHDPEILEKIHAAKAYFGIKTHHLEKMLEIPA
jgi:SAM-dependent methyltransferase